MAKRKRKKARSKKYKKKVVIFLHYRDSEKSTSECDIGCCGKIGFYSPLAIAPTRDMVTCKVCIKSALYQMDGFND